MSTSDKARKLIEKLPPRIASVVIGSAGRIPKVRTLLEAEYETMLDAAPVVRPRADVPVYSRLPENGRDRDDLIADVSRLAEAEHREWSDGYASGAVYHGDSEHIDFLNQVYSLQSQSNPLHLDLWPSGMKFESEIVAMTAGMLGGRVAAQTGDEIVGTVTSGGTESIIMAMKAYRDRAGIAKPQMVIPNSAHVAFDKAAAYFGYTQVRVPVGDDFRADVDAMAKAMTKRTVIVVGSTPGFPHGVIDPIAELSDMARERGAGFHTDACLGGFVLPWAERLGYDIPPFDFRLPGVTSMSADTHKYGYAAKGTSVVLYRGRDLRRHQFHVATEWPGGLYYSPTLAGSRPGGLLAAAWAALVSMGEDGYTRATQAILATGAEIKAGIQDIDGRHVLGDRHVQRLLAAEVVDDRRQVGVGRPGDLAGAGALEAEPPEDVERRLDELGARLRAAILRGAAAIGTRAGLAPPAAFCRRRPIGSAAGVPLGLSIHVAPLRPGY